MNNLPAHFFVSCDGCLYDTRMPNWNTNPLRSPYSCSYTTIKNSLQLRATIRAGNYVWPGGYPLYFIANDGEALCFDCVRLEYYQCAYSVRHKINDGWRIIGCTTNDEDPNLYCTHCNRRIPSSYGDDETETENDE